MNNIPKASEALAISNGVTAEMALERVIQTALVYLSMGISNAAEKGMKSTYVNNRLILDLTMESALKLKERLECLGYKVEVTHEDGGTALWGDRIVVTVSWDNNV